MGNDTDTAGHTGEDIKGVEWLGACYDILKADLLDLGHSARPGRNVFRIARDDSGADYPTYRSGAYSVPVGVKLRHAPSLDVQSTSDMIASSYEFRDKITREFSVNGGFGSYFEFSASTSSEQTRERTGSHQEMVKFCVLLRKFNNVMLDVHADAQSAEITALRARLDPDFARAVRALPADDGEAYHRFVAEYGTHFAGQLTLGGMAWEQVRVKAEALGTNQTSIEKIEAQASVGVDQFKTGTSASQATEHARKKDSELKIERTQIKFVGGKGGLELVSGFVAEVDDDPVPIMPESEFLRLTDLFTPAFFPDVPDIADKAEKLNDAIDEHILTNGKGTNDCIYYNEPNTWLGIEEVLLGGGGGSAGPRGLGPVEPVTYPLLITADGHLMAPANPHTNPGGLPAARIVLEPATEPGLQGQIAYFGADYPVRLLVQEDGGRKRGYLHWTKNSFYAITGSLFEVVLAAQPDPAHSTWLIELYAPDRKQDFPRALVTGDRVAVYRLEDLAARRRGHFLRMEPRTTGVPAGLPPKAVPDLCARVHTGPFQGEVPPQKTRSLFTFTLHNGAGRRL